MNVKDARKGDYVWVEDCLGRLRQERVKSVFKYHIVIGSQRFQISSGWEMKFKNSLLSRGEQPHRERIHYGSGELFTQEDADRRTIRERATLSRESLIYRITHLTSTELRKCSTEVLSQILYLLEELDSDREK